MLDLKQPEARAALDRLIATSDVLVCNFPPPVRDKLKLTYDDVKRVNPRLIYASLTGYGETGPDRDRPGFDVTAYFARSGLLDAQRYEGGPPGVPVPAQGDRATAMTLVSAILMALIHRMKTGEGSWVGTSLLGNGLWSCGVIAQAALVGAYLPHRPPPDRPRSALGTIYRTSDDRWLQLTIVREDKMWPGICETIGRLEALDDPRFATVEERRKRSGELASHPGRGLRQPRLRALAQDDVRARHHLRRHQPAAGRARRRSRRWPAAPSSTPPSPKCRARLPIRSAWASPSSGSPGLRRRSASTATRSWPRPACQREGDRQPAGERRYSMSETLPAQRAGRARHQLVHRSPRGGRRAGRFRRRRDQDRTARRRRPASSQLQERELPAERQELPWQLDGRLKRSIALDLKNTSARAVLERLIGRADIMIVNFPPPARERLKLRWEDIEPLNPRLVYCSLTGYGETGPDRDRPGFDVTAYFGRSGILDAARYEGGPPGLSLPAQGDRATAMTLVAAILLGLRQRDRTGKGCWVGTSLYANGVWANGTSAAGALIGAKLPPRQPPDKPRNALTNLYRTKDDRWLQLLMVRDDRLVAAVLRRHRPARSRRRSALHRPRRPPRARRSSWARS